VQRDVDLGLAPASVLTGAGRVDPLAQVHQLGVERPLVLDGIELLLPLVETVLDLV
jgi:hypothetical protein